MARPRLRERRSFRRLGMAMTYCLSCDGEIHADNPRLGARIICPECGDVLEVISTDPFDVDYPLDDDWEDDDWDDEEDDDDDY
jgi:lysine biosynthesis protein LysW